MYEDFYNLTDKPFRLTPDARFFFSSKAHKRALAYLRYGVNQGEGFIVVTGHVGTGKTTLLQILIDELGPDVVPAELTATPIASEDMVERLGAALGITYEGLRRTTVIKRVEHFLKQRIEEGLRVVLLVDEAQNLTWDALEELRMLANLEHKGKPFIQILLLGQDNFLQRLQAPDMEQFRQRITSSNHLSPLDPSETGGYIQHRLKLVGWKGDPSFTPETYLAIHRFTDGIPRRINTLCDRLMLYGFLDERHDLDSDAVAAVYEEMLQEIQHKGRQTEEKVECTTVPAQTPNSIAEALAEIGNMLASQMGRAQGQALQEQRLTALEQRLSALEQRLDSRPERPAPSAGVEGEDMEIRTARG